jgi:adenosylcobinamide-GDP ribazoletransferase
MDLSRLLRAERPAFRAALAFLTRLPLPATDWTPEAEAASPRWYPGAGLVVGAVCALVWCGAVLVWPPVVAALAAVAAGLVVTGGLHEDGFADACDGLGGNRPRDRVLEIMRDSRIGAYGVLGLGLMLGARVAVLSSLPAGAVPFVLVAGHAASRASMLWVMASSSYARTEGAASRVAGVMDQRGMAIGLGTAGLALLPLPFVLPLGAVALGLAGLVAGHFAMRQRYEARLGGYTGDCLGSVQQCSELGFLLGLLALAAA